MLQAIEALLRLGQLDLAQQTIAAVARTHPDVQQLQFFTGWLAIECERPNHAVVAFRLAAGRDPTDALAWLGIAETSPDAVERAAAAERAERLAPHGPHRRIWYDLQRGRPHFAVTPLDALQRRYPEHAELTIWLAETQRRLGNDSAARALIEPLLRRHPRPIPALFLAAMLALDPRVAEHALRDVLRFDPLGVSLRRLVAPDAPPLALPESPVVALPSVLLAQLESLVPELPPGGESARLARSSGRAHVAKSGDSTAPTPGRDQDVESVLRNVEQAAQRLIGHVPLVLPDGQATTLLVAHRGALARSYGSSTADAILDAMAVYGDALAARGVRAEYVILDDREALTRFGNLAPARDLTPVACKQVIDGARGYLESLGHAIDAIVLIGGDEHLPFHRLPNPSQDSDPDVPSDNPYGSSNGSELAPDLIVARFPDGGADGGRLLLEQLDRAARYHRHWHITGPEGGVLRLPFMRRLSRAFQPGGPVTAWGVSAEAWSLPSQTIYSELGCSRPLHFCPPIEPHTLRAGWPGSDSRVLYFNVHGIQGGPNWYGQAGDADPDTPLPIALTPDDIGAIAPATICVSEACFGAEIIGRSPRDAVALRMIDQGALAFVGSTVTAYGAVALPLGGADLLTQQLFQNLRRGYPVGRALALARDWMAREMVQRQGYLDPDDAKTLLSFVILGDPWATPYTRPALERKTAQPQITPIVAQRRPVAVEAVAPGAVQVARTMIAKVAPALSRAAITAVGQARPDRIAKGLATAVVFSASDRLYTHDGRAIEQIARVTVAGAEARKVLLSR